MPVNLETINRTIHKVSTLIEANSRKIETNKRALIVDVGVLIGWGTVLVGSYAFDLTDKGDLGAILGMATQLGTLTSATLCATRYSTINTLGELNSNLELNKYILEDMYRSGCLVNRYPQIIEGKDIIYVQAPIPPLTLATFEN